MKEDESYNATFPVEWSAGSRKPAPRGEMVSVGVYIDDVTAVRRAANCVGLLRWPLAGAPCAISFTPSRPTRTHCALLVNGTLVETVYQEKRIHIEVAVNERDAFAFRIVHVQDTYSDQVLFHVNSVNHRSDMGDGGYHTTLAAMFRESRHVKGSFASVNCGLLCGLLHPDFQRHLLEVYGWDIFHAVNAHVKALPQANADYDALYRASRYLDFVLSSDTVSAHTRLRARFRDLNTTVKRRLAETLPRVRVRKRVRIACDKDYIRTFPTDDEEVYNPIQLVYAAWSQDEA